MYVFQKKRKNNNINSKKAKIYANKEENIMTASEAIFRKVSKVYNASVDMIELLLHDFSLVRNFKLILFCDKPTKVYNNSSF